MIKTFAKEVDDGLSAYNKSLPSRYFYDSKGDDLFVKIMNMPEYYLTDAELEIFNCQTNELIQSFGMNGEHFEVVELGAGDGLKVIKLLKQLNGHNFTYAAIDISVNAIEKLKTRLLDEIPGLDFDGQQGEYFDVLDSLKDVGKKVILFLGSNIGNLTDSLAHKFMGKISESMNPHDKLMIGFDLKKDPEVIENAYNDPHGYTREFNLNLLRRINRELGGDFSVEKFEHAPEYHSDSGAALSYLVSLEEQSVYIQATGTSYDFKKGERIHTEISRKYDLETIHKIAKDTGLIVRKTFYDSRNYFIDVLFEKE
ncbi:MAG: L-histidine N(alpha)-methyltransferase [Cyclobacteriaceae bacterium]|nr:L-histidine N(alpha)-methyltransferase [Cyclobacteriaceae bacterium]